MVIFVPIGPQYIKKEDAKSFVKRERKTFGIAQLGFLIVAGLFQFLVRPKLLNLYKESNESLPLMTQLFPLMLGIIVVISVIVGLYFLITAPNYERLEQVLNKHKDGEMISSKELRQINFMTHDLPFLLLIGLFIGIIIVSIILPLYNLVNKI